MNMEEGFDRLYILGRAIVMWSDMGRAQVRDEMIDKMRDCIIELNKGVKPMKDPTPLKESRLYLDRKDLIIQRLVCVHRQTEIGMYDLNVPASRMSVLLTEESALWEELYKMYPED